jgi:hypothetical protein
MARILVIGEDGQLEEALSRRGHAVRTLSAPGNLAGILPELQGVSALAWLAGPELLESLAAKLVDTHVRGFACEPSGQPIAERFARTYGMPTAILRGGPDEAADAVESILSA